jgi:Mg2+ and Co2+ transporter CorA
VSGIFGMNVSDLPFTKEPGGFLWAMALLVMATIAIYAVLRLMRIMR